MFHTSQRDDDHTEIIYKEFWDFQIQVLNKWKAFHSQLIVKWNIWGNFILCCSLAESFYFCLSKPMSQRFSLMIVFIFLTKIMSAKDDIFCFCFCNVALKIFVTYLFDIVLHGNLLIFSHYKSQGKPLKPDKGL